MPLSTIFQLIRGGQFDWWWNPKKTTGWFLILESFYPTTNRTDPHELTEILLKVAINTITLTLKKATIYENLL
jgi:hypothetical protein